MQQSHSSIGIFPASENMRSSQYKGVSIVANEYGQISWQLGGDAVKGVLINNPIKGEACHVVLSGVAPVKLDAATDPVVVGDTLIATSSGTFTKGPGTTIALYNSTAGGIIPAMLGTGMPLTYGSGIPYVTSDDVIVSTVYDIYFIDCTASNRTVYLPVAAGSMGRRLVFKKMDASVNTITFTPSGTDTVEDTSVIVTWLKGTSITLIPTIDGWHII